MSKHTPGPWKWYGSELLSPDHFVMCCAKTGRPDTADAHLIAAAPELLEACMLARHICDEGNALQQLIDAAIAKAVQS